MGSELLQSNAQFLQNNLVQCMDNKLMGTLMSDKQKRHRRRAAMIDRHY